MKVIGVDLRCLPQDGSAGAGIAHAARALCDSLSSHVPRPTSHVELRFYVPRGASWKRGEVVWLEDATGKSLRSALRDKPCDLLFVPGGSIAPGIKIPCVPWVHDLIIFEHPEWFNQSWLKCQLTTRMFARGLRKAPIIFAVSEYTKSKIVELLKIDAGRIVVTYEGGDAYFDELRTLNSELRTPNNELRTPPFVEATGGRPNNEQRRRQATEFCRGELGIERGFVLALGTVEPRKNVAMLISAWKRARQMSEQALDLVVAGADGWKFGDVEAEIKSLSAVEEQFFYRLKTITDDEKRNLLLAADLVAVPSLDEGFGLVALEAMQAGTLVAVSNRGALPEVVGQAGIFLEPHDEQAWASAILTCIQDKRACKLRSELGLKQAAEFSWEKTGKIVFESLGSLIT